MRFRDLPITRKVYLIVLVASVCAFLLAGIGVVIYDAATLRARALHDLAADAAIVEANSTAALAFGDPRAAGEILATLHARPDIRAAAIYDVSSRLFAGYQRVGVEDSLPPMTAPALGDHVAVRRIVLSVPIVQEQERLGQLAIWADLPPLWQRLPQYGITVTVVALALLAVAALLTSLLRSEISAPLSALAHTARAVTERGDYGVRARKRGADEIGRLTDALNSMLAAIEARDAALSRNAAQLAEDLQHRRQLEEQLRQAQKLEAIGRLAGGIAHDFNNLLTAINGYAAFALRSLPTDEPAAADVREIQRAGERAARLTQQLLAYSRRQVLQPTAIDLDELVGDISKLIARLIGEQIALEVRPSPEEIRVHADRGSLEQVIVNLAVNARDAMPDGGQLTITTSIVELNAARLTSLGNLPPGRYARLSVADTGHGMDAETVEHVFEPFFTTKEVGKGTGLGLAMVYGTVAQSGGTVTVISAPGRGATFTIYLPIAETDSVAVPEPTPPAPRGREVILIVEDDPAVRTLATRSLEEYGYRVLEASSGREVDELLRPRTSDGIVPIDLLLTDVVMPNESGRQLADRLRTRWPGLRVLYTSGYTDDAIFAPDASDDAGAVLLQKPFSPESLARTVREILDAPPS